MELMSRQCSLCLGPEVKLGAKCPGCGAVLLFVDSAGIGHWRRPPEPSASEHKCRNGHVWYEKADAEKCCNPEWRRVLLLGDDVKLSEVPLQVDGPSGAVYGRRWERVAVPA